MISRISKIVILSLLLLATVSCQKQEEVEPLDYSVQVIPDIASILQGHEDLISAMDSLGQLFFGDQPPKLYTVDTTEGKNDTLQWFSGTLVYEGFIPSISEHQDYNQPNGGECHFRFYDQHRGIAKYDYENTRPNSNPYLPPTTSYTHVTDSVFIMGHGDYFTAFFTLKQEMKDVPGRGTTLAVILAGKVQRDGIHDFYYGYKIIGYDNSPLPQYSHIDDIYLYKKDVMPFAQWESEQTNDNNP